MPNALDPGLVSDRECSSLDALLELRAQGDVYTEAGHVRYGLSGVGGVGVMASDLPSSFVLRRECCRLPDQVIWADDSEWAIVLAQPFETARDLDLPPLVFSAELWSSENGYQDRLDQLAPVAVTAA